MNKTTHTINLTKGFLCIIVIAIIITISSLLLTNISQVRKDSITQTYLSETTDYITQNQTGLVEIFNEVFIYTCQEKYATCQTKDPGRIFDLISSDLKDFSSTHFLKLSPSGKIQSMSLHGEMSGYGYHYNSKKAEEIKSLIRGETDHLPWDQYQNHWQNKNKQIIVAIKDQEGKTLGALVRTVIED